MKIGQRLRRLRRYRGMTQAAMARAAFVGQADVSRYESGKRSLSVDIAEALAKALNVPTTALVDDAVCIAYSPEEER